MTYSEATQTTPVFLRFINMIINDAIVQLDEGLEVRELCFCNVARGLYITTSSIPNPRTTPKCVLCPVRSIPLTQILEPLRVLCPVPSILLTQILEPLRVLCLVPSIPLTQILEPLRVLCPVHSIPLTQILEPLRGLCPVPSIPLNHSVFYALCLASH